MLDLTDDQRDQLARALEGRTPEQVVALLSDAVRVPQAPPLRRSRYGEIIALARSALRLTHPELAHLCNATPGEIRTWSDTFVEPNGYARQQLEALGGLLRRLADRFDDPDAALAYMVRRITRPLDGMSLLGLVKVGRIDLALTELDRDELGGGPAYWVDGREAEAG